MATNYTDGHMWDKLDAQACIRGALEIEALRAAAPKPAEPERGICGEIRGACGLPCEPCEGKPDVGLAAQQPGTPYANCRFKICDLPGQCKGEGKCHHPHVPVAANAVSEPQLVGCAYYASNGSCCESGEASKLEEAFNAG